MGKRIYDLEELEQLNDNDYLLVDREGNQKAQKIKVSTIAKTIGVEGKSDVLIIPDETSISYDEILSAIENNKIILLCIGDEMAVCNTSVDENGAIKIIYPWAKGIYNITIYDDNTYSVDGTTIIEIGDISNPNADQTLSSMDIVDELNKKTENFIIDMENITITYDDLLNEIHNKKQIILKMGDVFCNIVNIEILESLIILIYLQTDGTINITKIHKDNTYEWRIYGIDSYSIEESDSTTLSPPTSEVKKYVTNSIAESEEEMKLRDERLKYYGDPDIVPSDESLFTFTKDDETMTASIVLTDEAKADTEIGDIVIPYSCVIDDKTYLVTEIGIYAFADSYVKNLKLPNSIKKIDYYSFHYMNNFSEDGYYELYLPDSITEIIEPAFGESYYKIMNVPKDLVLSERAFDCANVGFDTVATSPINTSIPDWCFNTIPSVIFDIPNSVKEIGKGNFSGNSKITSLIIPDTVEYLGEYVSGCENLRYIKFSTAMDSILDVTNLPLLEVAVIPKNITSINEGVFYNCPNLTIHCYKGSVAEKYAIDHNIPYKLLDADIITTSAETIVLENQQDIRLQELTGTYSLSFPRTQDSTNYMISDAYECSLTFTAGDGLTLSYTDAPIIWHGEDCDSEGDFVPESNKTYEISVKKVNEKTLEDGTIEPVIVARVGEV